jgi:hypothetical protein
MNVKIDQVDYKPPKTQDPRSIKLLNSTGITSYYSIYIISYRYLYIGTPTLLILLFY